MATALGLLHISGLRVHLLKIHTCFSYRPVGPGDKLWQFLVPAVSVFHPGAIQPEEHYNRYAIASYTDTDPQHYNIQPITMII